MTAGGGLGAFGGSSSVVDGRSALSASARGATTKLRMGRSCTGDGVGVGRRRRRVRIDEACAAMVYRWSPVPTSVRAPARAAHSSTDGDVSSYE